MHAVASRAVKDALKVAAKAVAAVAKVAVVAVVVDAASAPARARVSVWMLKANPWQPNSAPMAHARHRT